MLLITEPVLLLLHQVNPKDKTTLKDLTLDITNPPKRDSISPLFKLPVFTFMLYSNEVTVIKNKTKQHSQSSFL